MSLTFDRGNENRPSGHAILYYRSGSGIVATYVVVLPLTVDLTKYVPPVMASQVKAQGLEEFSAFAVPPVPEEVQSYEFLQELARLRGDDLVCGGEVPSNDFLETAQRVSEAVQSYAGVYQQWAEVEKTKAPAETELAGVSVGEVLFSLMGEKDKLEELAKLVGKLQFAVEVRDKRLIGEAEEEVGTLARYLPESYRVQRIVEAAERSMARGTHLAQLYLERCYKLADGDEEGLQKVEQAISELEPPSEGSSRREDP